MSKQILFVSPHYDDAVFSATPLMLKEQSKGNEVTILTVFGGFTTNYVSDFGKTLFTHWGFSSGTEAIKKRKKENLKASAILDAYVYDLDFNDFIFRKKPFNTGALEEKLKEFEKAFDAVYFLSPTGNPHIDHKIVADAVRKVFKWTPKFSYFFYSVPKREQVEHNVSTYYLNKVTFKELKTWVKSVSCYESQIRDPYLFKNKKDMILTYFKLAVQGIKFAKVY